METGNTREGGAGAQLGKARLRLIDVIAQSVGFMGPVFVAALVLPLVVASGAAQKGAGVATPFAVLLATIGILAIGWIVARYARRIQSAGALYDYVMHAFGARVGFWAGWVYYWGTMALTAAMPLIFGGIVNGLLHDDIGWESAPPYWAWALLYCGIVFALLYFGVFISMRAQLALTLISMTVVSGFMIYIVAKGGAGGDSNSIRPFLPGSAAEGWSGIFYGILYSTLIFVGFESAANLAEETADPKRIIPPAILLSILIAGAFYLLVAYAQAIGFGLDARKWGASASTGPLFVLGAPGAFGSVTFNRVLRIIVILDSVAVGVGAAVSTSRGVFALARDRRLPAALATVSRRHGTPAGAILFTVALCVVVAGSARLGHGVLSREIPGVPPSVALFPEYFPLFSWLAGFGGFSILIVYATVAIAGIRGLWDVENRAALVIAGVVGCAFALGGLWGAMYQVPSPADTIPRAVLGLLVAGMAISFAVRGRPLRGRSVDQPAGATNGSMPGP